MPAGAGHLDRGDRALVRGEAPEPEQVLAASAGAARMVGERDRVRDRRRPRKFGARPAMTLASGRRGAALGVAWAGLHGSAPARLSASAPCTVCRNGVPVRLESIRPSGPLWSLNDVKVAGFGHPGEGAQQLGLRLPELLAAALRGNGASESRARPGVTGGEQRHVMPGLGEAVARAGSRPPRCRRSARAARRTTGATTPMRRASSSCVRRSSRYGSRTWAKGSSSSFSTETILRLGLSGLPGGDDCGSYRRDWLPGTVLMPGSG